MHLKVFVKMKKPWKPSRLGKKNPKKPQKTQKNPLGWFFFFFKTGFFQPWPIRIWILFDADADPDLQHSFNLDPHTWLKHIEKKVMAFRRSKCFLNTSVSYGKLEILPWRRDLRWWASYVGETSPLPRQWVAGHLDYRATSQWCNKKELIWFQYKNLKDC